jgi:hypothetical protein
MPETITPERVSELLRALGNTADEVAETLRAGGFRGTQADAAACPIACYLKARDVDVIGVRYENLKVRITGRIHLLTMPDAAGEFAEEFDSDRYPALMVSP